MEAIFSNNPIILLFVVASIGYLLGSIKIKGHSFGVAAILFTGLFISAVNSDLVDKDSKILEGILLLGLCMFTYSVGLSSGPAFFASYQKNGFKDFIFVFLMLLFTGFIAIGLFHLFGFSAATITGIYAGSTTNTAALAGVLDYVKSSTSATDFANFSEQIVIGYSFSYPMGVLGGMIAIVLLEKFLKIDYKEESKLLKKTYAVESDLSSSSIKILNETVCNISLRALVKTQNLELVFGRLVRKDKSSLCNWDTHFCINDQVMVIGSVDDLEKAATLFGKALKKKISYDRSEYDTRRIFVSDPKLAGKTIASLNLEEKYDAVITRIRRGDMDMLAKKDAIIELGDRIRFVAKREDLNAISNFFGDSYQASSKVNLFSFGLGIGLGLLLGSIEFNLSSDISFKLGYAGGPLIVGLILGALRRTGSIVWSLSYGANITLQQIGLILLLSVIGLRAGGALYEVFSLQGLYIVLASAIVSLLTAIAILLIGYKVAKKPFSILMGMVANQPAILEFAKERAGSKIPEFGFTMMFPIALILKIIIAQFLYLILS